MRSYLTFSTILALLLVNSSVLGCSNQEDPLTNVGVSDSSSDVTDSTDGVDDTSVTDGTDGADTTSMSDATDAQDGVDSSASGSTKGANFCEADTDCNNQLCNENVCVVVPDEDTYLTDNTTDEQVDDPPNLDCVGATWISFADETVTIYGIVDRFGAGRPTTEIEVSLFLADEWPPLDISSLDLSDPESVREAFRNVTTKEGWTVTSVVPSVPDADLPQGCDGDRECPIGYECFEPGEPQSGCEPEFGIYEIANVPADVPLVIRATSKTGVSALDNKWKDTYSYNLVAQSNWAEEDGRVRMNALMVSDGQWQTVPNTLGLVGGIKAGNGAVGGRIRDCGTIERRGFTMAEVSVGLERPGKATGYFNTSETDTVPLVGRNTTNIFGRFTAVDIPAGPNRLTGVATVDGQVTSLGAESFFLVPDSLAVITLPGKAPVFNK